VGKRETIPREHTETLRQELANCLDGREIPVSVLSRMVRKSEREIHDHLEQMRLSGLLRITPARCARCGYAFDSRQRTKKPGKCPKCKGTFIEEPLFSMKSA
jgi:predicted Zn-ribbon and HTH transcriptional regulator